MKIDSVLCVDKVVSLKELNRKWGEAEKELVDSNLLGNIEDRFDVVMFHLSAEEKCKHLAEKCLIASGDSQELINAGYRLGTIAHREFGFKSVWKVGTSFDWDGKFSFSLDWDLLKEEFQNVDPIFYQTISAHYVVNNEIDWIGWSIASLILGRVDEIVIVDTGSTDGTLEVIQSFVDWAKDRSEIDIKLLHCENNIREFGKVRNYAIDNCTKDWLLLIDGDEVYPKESLDRIKLLINLNPFDSDCYRFPDYQIGYGWKCRDTIGKKKGYDRLYRNHIGYNWKGSWPDEHPYIGDNICHTKALHVQDIYYCHFAFWKSWKGNESRCKNLAHNFKDEVEVKKFVIKKVLNELKDADVVDFPQEMIPDIFSMNTLAKVLWTKHGIEPEEFWNCYYQKKEWLPRKINLPENIFE